MPGGLVRRWRAAQWSVGSGQWAGRPPHTTWMGGGPTADCEARSAVLPTCIIRAHVVQNTRLDLRRPGRVDYRRPAKSHRPRIRRRRCELYRALDERGEA